MITIGLVLLNVLPFLLAGCSGQQGYDRHEKQVGGLEFAGILQGPYAGQKIDPNSVILSGERSWTLKDGNYYYPGLLAVHGGRLEIRNARLHLQMLLLSDQDVGATLSLVNATLVIDWTMSLTPNCRLLLENSRILPGTRLPFQLGPQGVG
ncbi:MAG: hypothetical protein LC620_02760, partial [Halobacteriales archaeon]|nr:hypothetical protein [Halobacteriales archaeon]